MIPHSDKKNYNHYIASIRVLMSKIFFGQYLYKLHIDRCSLHISTYLKTRRIDK